jgi:predicted nucleic acid-binding protein
LSYIVGSPTGAECLVGLAYLAARRSGWGHLPCTRESHLGERAVEVLENLPGSRLVEMDQRLVGVAVDLAVRLGLRGADSFYVAIAQTLELPLATLDEDQRSRAESLVTVVEIT